MARPPPPTPVCCLLVCSTVGARIFLEGFHPTNYRAPCQRLPRLRSTPKTQSQDRTTAHRPRLRQKCRSQPPPAPRLRPTRNLSLSKKRETHPVLHQSNTTEKKENLTFPPTYNPSISTITSKMKPGAYVHISCQKRLQSIQTSRHGGSNPLTRQCFRTRRFSCFFSREKNGKHKQKKAGGGGGWQLLIMLPSGTKQAETTRKTTKSVTRQFS